MRAVDKVRNVLRGLLQRFGTENIKRWLWNYEYGRGRWNCLDTMADDYVYRHVETCAKNGSILDLGCGPGAVGNELNAAAYHSYTGVDISDAAIEKARSRTAENRRTDKNHYFQGDILSYIPKQKYDVILFGDSIYYFQPQRNCRDSKSVLQVFEAGRRFHRKELDHASQVSNHHPQHRE
jgi:SAM-dependent methyltransferase